MLALFFVFLSGGLRSRFWGLSPWFLCFVCFFFADVLFLLILVTFVRISLGPFLPSLPLLTCCSFFIGKEPQRSHAEWLRIQKRLCSFKHRERTQKKGDKSFVCPVCPAHLRFKTPPKQEHLNKGGPQRTDRLSTGGVAEGQEPWRSHGHWDEVRSRRVAGGFLVGSKTFCRFCFCFFECFLLVFVIDEGAWYGVFDMFCIFCW